MNRLTLKVSRCFDGEHLREARSIAVTVRGDTIAEVRFDAPDHPLLKGLAPFAFDDEVYGNLAMEGDVVPLMHARPATGGWQPMLWERQVGGGRVVYDALGHDAAALSHPVHRRIVARAALLALGRDAATVEAA